MSFFGVASSRGTREHRLVHMSIDSILVNIHLTRWNTMSHMCSFEYLTEESLFEVRLAGKKQGRYEQEEKELLM